MKGYQITFFTQQDKRHDHESLAEWLMFAAKKLGVSGATIVAANEGFGQHGRIHSVHFFELADQPLEVVMAVTEDEAKQLFDLIEREGVHLFYIKSEVEFGALGETGQITGT